ncbi:steroid 17-alpha-hydroxylase/17,20 lyase-like isoform X2 [Ostrea edulis]|uniref:steroid 17-alpha-hydroxylase/17,20 lyase-like isoform X2 n=1 Tax=Ostrea edulis TaxID=37623 RepID=UPI0024AEAED9|nr:steroid 17-alpha-hydroxylase/17,20 lyase-like isoform X2 [Ostrea edulis]
MINISLNTQTVLVGVSMGIVVYYVIKRMRYRLPPGPWCIPFVGHYTVYSSLEVHRKVTELSKIYGPVVRLCFGSTTMVFLNDVEVVLEAMVKKKADFAGRPKIASGEMVSEGGKDIIFSTYTPTWKFHRRIAGKAIRHYLQGDLLENMIQNSMEEFLVKMAQEKEPFSVKNYVDRMVFHQLYTICFGEKRPIDDPEIEELLKLDDDIIEDFGVGVLEDIFPYLKDIYPTAKWKRMTDKMNRIMDILRTKFKQHVDTIEPGVNRDFTDSLLIARQEAENERDEAALEKLDDTHLIQTISDIFLAGVETTRFTMDWFVYFMTKHPEIQSKCQEEIDRVVGMERPSMKNRDNLHFIEACIFETLRLGNVAGVGPPHMTICDSQVDILWNIAVKGKLPTQIYDKQDDFSFSIFNFPYLCSNVSLSLAHYNVYLYQLIR